MPEPYTNRRISDGEIEDLFRDFNRGLRRIVQAKITSASTSAIADACAFAWAELAYYRPVPTATRAWLIKVAQREAIRLGVREPRGQERGEFSDALCADTETAVQAHELLEHVAALPGRRRETVTLLMRGLSYDEIACELGITLRQVDRDLVTVRDQLRQELAVTT